MRTYALYRENKSIVAILYLLYLVSSTILLLRRSIVIFLQIEFVAFVLETVYYTKVFSCTPCFIHFVCLSNGLFKTRFCQLLVCLLYDWTGYVLP